MIDLENDELEYEEEVDSDENFILWITLNTDINNKDYSAIHDQVDFNHWLEYFNFRDQAGWMVLSISSTYSHPFTP